MEIINEIKIITIWIEANIWGYKCWKNGEYGVRAVMYFYMEKIELKMSSKAYGFYNGKLLTLG